MPGNTLEGRSLCTPYEMAHNKTERVRLTMWWAPQEAEDASNVEHLPKRAPATSGAMWAAAGKATEVGAAQACGTHTLMPQASEAGHSV